jgi:hypothetical protein
MKIKKLYILVSLLLLSCIKKEEINSNTNKINNFTLFSPLQNSQIAFQDTVFVLGNYFLKNDKKNSVISYSVDIQNLSQNYYISRDTLNIRGEELAYFYTLKNEFADTTEISIEVYQNPSYGNEKGTVAVHKITYLPN